MPAVHLLITGKVQRVFYRAAAKQKADELAITGWIKNTKEGNVEAIASGNNNKQLQDFINWCKQGPRRAAVTEVIVTEAESIIYEEFVILR